VITETVGVGQSELEIAETADTTVVVLVPESGDSIQAMKAGLMEVADVFVINKADRPGADRLAQEIEVMLHMRLGEAQPAAAGHHGVSLKSVGKAARERTRVPRRGSAGRVGDPRAEDGGAERRGARGAGRDPGPPRGVSGGERRAVAPPPPRRMEERVRAVVERDLRRMAWRSGPGEEILEEALPALESGEESPYTVAARIVRALRMETTAGDG
jgi:LAO/AO transport system kinase